MKWFFQSGNHAGGLIARITLALVILPHGLQLLLGWFGGYGFTASMEYFTSTVRLPWLVGFLVILLQSFGALFLLAGFATRPLALATIFLFAGMIFTAHLEFGFFMNWYGTQKGEGFEFHLLVIGLALLLFLDGAGKYSFDSLLAKSFFKSQNQPA
jgi:putative oxidoreductase